VFIAFPCLDIPEGMAALVEMINGLYGLQMTADDFNALGVYVLKTEHQFNLQAGFTNQHDRLPEFFATDPLPPHNTVWDFTGEEIDQFWNF